MVESVFDEGQVSVKWWSPSGLICCGRYRAQWISFGLYLLLSKVCIQSLSVLDAVCTRTSLQMKAAHSSGTSENTSTTWHFKILSSDTSLYVNLWNCLCLCVRMGLSSPYKVILLTVCRLNFNVLFYFKKKCSILKICVCVCAHARMLVCMYVYQNFIL